MRLDRTLMELEVKRIPPDRALKLRGDCAWIRCWSHADGQERTPSLRLNLDGRYIGRFRCFACGFHGTWSDFAGHFHLKGGTSSVTDDADGLFIHTMSSGDVDDLLSDEGVNERRRIIENSPEFPIDMVWRGIRGWLLNAIGAKVVFDEHGPQVYLPIMMGREWTSGIYCTWEKRDRSYFNEPDPRIKRSVFPFNYAKSILADKEPGERMLALVEGPRDALNLLQNDIPAVAILGGTSVWGPPKLDAIMDLSPDGLVTAFDPDEVGQALTVKVRSDASKFISRSMIKRFRMRVTKRSDGVIFKQDPGNLSERDMIRFREGMASMSNRPAAS